MSVVDDPVRPDIPPTVTPKKSTPATRPTGLFRSFWRWHFYASVIVIPVMLTLAITGLIYLFRFQIEPFVHADLMRVEQPAGQDRMPYAPQAKAVEAALPGARLVSMTEPAAPDHSTRFTVQTAHGQTRDVFVDPYEGQVLGSLNPDTTISGTAVRIHADLMAGTVGDAVMELGSCWAIVMALTGYYLFFKGRKARRRMRAKKAPGAQLRTNHARVGSLVGLGVLALVVSGLPWTGVWGSQVQKVATASGSSLWSEDHGALSQPTSTLDESLPHSHHTVPWAQEKSGVPQSTKPGDLVSVANIDTAVVVAGRAGLAHPMTVALPADDKGVFSTIGYAFNDPSKERSIHIDQYGGQVVSTYGYADYPALAKVVTQGIALHEGRRFGTLNLVLTTLFCVALVTSCITGPLMWWRRRPRGKAELGAPRGRLPLRGTPALAAVVVALAVFLPLFGASLVIVLLLDRYVLGRHEGSRRFFGLNRA